MNLTFKLNIAPLTLNSCERSNDKGRRYKSAAYDAWVEEASIELHRNREAIKIFARQFSSKKDFIVAEYVFGLPNMFCKTGKRKGCLNLTAGDWDDYPKPIQDLIFEVLESANEEINNAYIIAGTARKIEAQKPFISVSYTLVDGL